MQSQLLRDEEWRGLCNSKSYAWCEEYDTIIALILRQNRKSEFFSNGGGRKFPPTGQGKWEGRAHGASAVWMPRPKPRSKG